MTPTREPHQSLATRSHLAAGARLASWHTPGLCVHVLAPGKPMPGFVRLSHAGETTTVKQR
jgi:hypothetical protein